jgi:hypothetical protein
MTRRINSLEDKTGHSAYSMKERRRRRRKRSRRRRRKRSYVPKEWRIIQLGYIKHKEGKKQK